MRLLAGVALLSTALSGHAALAQAYQCRMASAPVSVPPIQRDGPVRRMEVTGYTLALSWSPEHCRFREDSTAHKAQCSGENGRFGLVVHGLWPEGPSGRWPQWCPTSHTPSPELIRRNMCMTPSARLIAHEWAKHGACMVKTPEAYLKVSAILWDSLVPWLPDLDRVSRKHGLTAGDIRRAFTQANRYWKPEQVGIDLDSKGWLEEIRLCYGADFRPARCTAGQFGAEDGEDANIWRGL